MKIKHKVLEEIRQNPERYSEINRKVRFGGSSQYRDWQLATRVYHKINKQESINYLVNAFGIHYKQNSINDRKLEEYISRLEVYISDFESLRNLSISCGNRLNMDIENSISLGGEIARIDKTLDKGLEIYLFVKEDYEWEKELRFPLLQFYYAKKYNVELSKTAVGVYCLEYGQHSIKKYTDKEVSKGVNEVKKISKIIYSTR